eukprot:11156288-Lingulodinium_polyedra.AAC.1
MVPLEDALCCMVIGEVKHSYSDCRRLACRTVVASIAFALSFCAETTKEDSLWSETQLVQIEQLRAARGYKRPSPAYKAAVVSLCSEKKKLKT